MKQLTALLLLCAMMFLGTDMQAEYQSNDLDVIIATQEQAPSVEGTALQGVSYQVYESVNSNVQKVKDWELPSASAGNRIYAFQAGTDETSNQVDEVDDEPEPNFFRNTIDWIKENWMMFIVGFMAFLKVVVNLTPTDQDNKVFAWLDNLISSLFPSRKTGGGTHPTS